jgi:diadenylate cyclase
MMPQDQAAGTKHSRGPYRSPAGSCDGLADALRRVAPGTGLREALDNMISADGGALIVIGDEAGVAPLCDGGFALSVPFTPQRLFELTKMDGAILLDEDCRTILRANVHLVPDPSLPTAETGMRHRTAERVSRQTSALVISVSRRRNVVSIYLHGCRTTLEDVTVVLAKANQALQTLQRFRLGLDQALGRLTLLEFEDAVTVADVVTTVQRSESVIRVTSEVARFVDELGSEGRLVAMQASEITANADEEHGLLVRDYAGDGRVHGVTAARGALAELSQDELADGCKIAAALGFPGTAESLEMAAKSRGYRVLRRIPALPAAVVNRLVERFAALGEIARASEQQLDEVDGIGARRARVISEGLRRLRETTIS